MADREPVTEVTENALLHVNLLLTGGDSSRSQTGGDEEPTSQSNVQLINDALVLLFQPDEGGNLASDSELIYIKKAEHPVKISENHYSLDFQCEIDPDNVLPNLVAVIMANGSGFYNAIYERMPLKYQDISKLVTSEYGDREQYAASLNREYFSLWGIASRNIDTSLLTQSLKVELIRDLAKTSVVLDAELTENFGHKLTGIMVYNRFDSMAHLPEIGTDNQPVLPTIPTNSTKTVMPDISSVEQDGIKASILHPEQDILMGSSSGRPIDNNKFNRPALIVGVDWRGSGRVYYYRVDYKEDDKLIDVKRNHHYLVNINDIKGPGADTPEDAYHIISTTVEAVVTPWTDMENDVEFDGDNWIAMERTVYLAPVEGSEGVLSFHSNVPAETWKMAWGSGDTEWDSLSFSEESEQISDDGAFRVRKGDTLIFTAIQSLPEGMEQRTNQLYINLTGRLRLMVNVVQTTSISSEGEGMTSWDDQTIFGEI